MREVIPGIFHWTTLHESIGVRVSSYYVEPAGIVIDPKVPEEGLEALPGTPQQVVLTTGLHDRDAQRFADAFDIPIRASFEAAERLGDALTIEPFNDGDEVAPGVTAIVIDVLCPDECALHIAVDKGAIAFADGLIRYGDALAFVPDDLLGAHPDRVKEGLKQAFLGLLTRDFDHLLFAHGEPLIGGGKAALRDFATSPVGHEDFGQAL
ncbi:MAG TPA: hypothetical protein VGO81_19620 [Solirubrobacteraceae bacterium]|jgi:hypothetical protein|nr:hypothetical protein [Solirubrobacteraceae bacterium]